MIAESPHLETLDLWDNKITDSGVTSISNYLRTNTTLTTLSLGKNLIGDDGAEIIATTLGRYLFLKIIFYKISYFSSLYIYNFYFNYRYLTIIYIHYQQKRQHRKRSSKLTLSLEKKKMKEERERVELPIL